MSLIQVFKKFMSRFEGNSVFYNLILSFLFHIGLNVVGTLVILLSSLIKGGAGFISNMFMILVLLFGLFFYQIIGEVLIPIEQKRQRMLSILSVPAVNLFVWVFCFLNAGGFNVSAAEQSSEVWATFGMVNPVLMTGGALMGVPLPFFALLVLVIQPMLMWRGMNRREKMPIPEEFLNKSQGKSKDQSKDQGKSKVPGNGKKKK